MNFPPNYLPFKNLLRFFHNNEPRLRRKNRVTRQLKSVIQASGNDGSGLHFDSRNNVIFRGFCLISSPIKKDDKVIQVKFRIIISIRPLRFWYESSKISFGDGRRFKKSRAESRRRLGFDQSNERL